MPYMPEVTILILNHNGREDTLECLSSLASLEYPDYGIVLVDNGSTDGSVAAVKEASECVDVVLNEDNLGFAAGVNAGLEHVLSSGSEYILVLNNDTVATDPEFLKTLVRFARGHPDAGPISPKVTYYGSGKIWFAGGRLSCLTGFARHIGKGSPENAVTGVPRRMEYVSGCCMLLSRRFLSTVGLFDPEYFFYYEDVDLCFRGARAGFSSFLVPGSVIQHKKSASAGFAGENRLSAFQAYYMARNALLFAGGNLSGWRCYAFLFAQFTTRLAYNMVQVSGKAATVEYMRGLRDGLGSFLRARRTRTPG